MGETRKKKRWKPEEIVAILRRVLLDKAGGSRPRLPLDNGTATTRPRHDDGAGRRNDVKRPGGKRQRPGANTPATRKP